MIKIILNQIIDDDGGLLGSISCSKMGCVYYPVEGIAMDENTLREIANKLEELNAR